MMGLFDKLMGLFGGGKESHFFASDSVRSKNAQALADAICSLVGGTVKTRDGGDEVHITGTVGGAPVRVVLDVTFGGAEFEIRSGGGDLCLLMHDDKGSDAYAGDRESRDAWDDDDEKVFVSKHLYFEGDADELATCRRFWDALPGGVRGVAVEVLERDRGTLCRNSDVVSLKPWEGFLGRGDAPALAQQYLDLLAQIAASSGTR